MTAAVVALGGVSVALLSVATFYLVRDARERRRDQLLADRRVIAHRASVARSRYLVDEIGRPE